MMPLVRQFMTLIEKQFGNQCEIVFSDLRDENDSQITDIRNGHVTNRSAGEKSQKIGIEIAPGVMSEGDRFNYVTTIRDGKILRSSTIYMHDSLGKAVASLTVNLDITDTLHMESFFRQYNRFEQAGGESQGFGLDDVNSLLDYLIEKGQQKVGKSAEEMTKAEKMEFIRYLDEKGAFLITKSGEKICEFLEISKFTFYSYLEKIRSVEEQ